MAIRNTLPDMWRSNAWSPFREMSRLQRRMDQMFGDLIEPTTLAGNLFQPGFERVEFTPACDIQETDSHYLLSFDIPGVSKDDVKIELRDNQLLVTGERKEEKEAKEGGIRSRERVYGSFQRYFTLPMVSERDKIEAHYENGVLHIAVPKSEASKPKEIPIHEGKSGLMTKLLGKGESKKSVA